MEATRVTKRRIVALITMDKVNLASSKYGAKVLFASDDFFAVCENMLKHTEPITNNEYTEFGKWMDGWETRRKRSEGHDFAIIKLGLNGTINEVEVDTFGFTGNHAPRVSIQAYYSNDDLEFQIPPREAELGSCAKTHDIFLVESLTSNWVEILPMTPLNPGYPASRFNNFKVSSGTPVSHIRVNIFPDGGIARIRVYGIVAPPMDQSGIIDLACVVNGGRPIKCSDSHFGSPVNLLSPDESEGMYDGWETARNPNRPPIFKKGADGQLEMPGSHYTIVKLGKTGILNEIWVETKHFKGNFPESCKIEGLLLPIETMNEGVNFNDYEANGMKRRKDIDENEWNLIVPRVKLGPDAIQKFKIDEFKVNLIRLTIYPDGGVSRLRVFGVMC